MDVLVGSVPSNLPTAANGSDTRALRGDFGPLTGEMGHYFVGTSHQLDERILPLSSSAAEWRVSELSLTRLPCLQLTLHSKK